MVHQRHPCAFSHESVVEEGIGAGVGVVFRQRKAGIGHSGIFGITREFQRRRLALPQLLHQLHVEITHSEFHVGARAIRLLVDILQQHPGLCAVVAESVSHFAIELGIPGGTGGSAQFGSGFSRGIGRQVVDDSTNRVRAETDLGRALQHFQTAEALNGRMVITSVVAIGAVGDGQAIFQQQYLGGACRVEAADADIGAQAETFFFPRENTRRLAQHLVDVEGTGMLDRLGIDDGGGTTDAGLVAGIADNHDGGNGFIHRLGHGGLHRHSEQAGKQGLDEQSGYRESRIHANFPEWESVYFASIETNENH